jgi:hypothetical protein|nr:MAG TPA: hypothetical protein [Caudoviricetes sp.]
MQELQVLNVNNADYEIADGKARTDITNIKEKSFLTSATLNAQYTQETKALKITLTTENEQIGG